VVSLLPGSDLDFAITVEGWNTDCARQTYRLRLDTTMTEPTIAVVGQLYEDAPFYNYVTTAGATYTYAGGQLLKLNNRLEVVATSPRDSLSGAVGDFLEAGGGYVLVALLAEDGSRTVVRFDTTTLLPVDSTIVTAPIALEWRDLLWADDSLHLFGVYEDPQTEYTRSGLLFGSAAVTSTFPAGSAFTFPNLDAELTDLDGKANVIPVFGFCNGPGCEGEAYAVRYDSLYVTVTNRGTETIEGFYIQAREAPDCSCSFCIQYQTFRQRFDGLGLGPGESRELALDPVTVNYQIGRSQLCLWLTSLNDAVDINREDNLICLESLVSTNAPVRMPVVKLTPNHAAGELTVATDLAGTHDAILFDLTGRRLASASGSASTVLPMPALRGVYLVQVVDKLGRSQTVKVVW